MDYSPLVFEYGDLIDVDMMNHLQGGIESAHKNLNGITVTPVDGGTTDGVHNYIMTLPNGKEFPFSVKDGEKGEQGEPGNVTIDNRPLRFFVGTKAEYDALEDQTNVFAIITDDPTQIGVIDAINGFLDGSIPIPNIEQNYVRKDENKIFVCSAFNGNYLPTITTNYSAVIGKFPESKTLDQIAGVSMLVKLEFDIQITTTSSFRHTALLYLYAHKLHDVVAANEGVKFHLFTVTHDSTTSSSGTTTFTNPVSMASMDVRLRNTGDGDIEIVFDNGAYTVIADERKGNAKLSDGVFKLVNVRWWFA